MPRSNLGWDHIMTTHEKSDWSTAHKHRERRGDQTNFQSTTTKTRAVVQEVSANNEISMEIASAPCDPIFNLYLFWSLNLVVFPVPADDFSVGCWGIPLMPTTVDRAGDVFVN